jgi:outer membrane murein-binding lipoprotein Lpp
VTILASVSPAPAHVSVEMLLGITSSLAKLDAKFDAKFDAVEASIAELKADVTALTSDVGELKVDVAVLKVDVAALKGDVGGLKVDVARLKAGASAMEADIRKLLDWKQRFLGMALLVGLVTAAAPSAWREVGRLLTRPHSVEQAMPAVD